MPTKNEVMNLIRQQQYEKFRKELLARNAAYAKPYWEKQLTKLTPEQEKQFMAWVQANKVPFDPKDKYPDYDMRGYYLSLMKGGADKPSVNAVDQRLHYPDTYKTPYHESFSKESQWATDKAPMWKGEKLVDSTGNIVFETKRNR